MQKKYFIILALPLLLLFGYGIFLNIQESRDKKSLIKRDDAFVSAWGTYSYLDFSTYPSRVKGFLTDSYFDEQFSDPQAQDIQLGRMTTKEYRIVTTAIRVISYKKTGDSVTINEEVKEVSSSNIEKYEKNKTVTVSWKKVGGNYLVESIRYN